MGAMSFLVINKREGFCSGCRTLLLFLEILYLKYESFSSIMTSTMRGRHTASFNILEGYYGDDLSEHEKCGGTGDCLRGDFKRAGIGWGIVCAK